MRCRSVSIVTAGALCRVVRLLGGETSASGSATVSATGSGAGSSTANAGSNSVDGEAGGSTTFTGSTAFTGSAAFTMGTAASSTFVPTGPTGSRLSHLDLLATG